MHQTAKLFYEVKALKPTLAGNQDNQDNQLQKKHTCPGRFQTFSGTSATLDASTRL